MGRSLHPRIAGTDKRVQAESILARTVEGQIRAYEAQAEQAQARLRELTGFGPPPIIPRERPPTEWARNDIAREIARWLVKNDGQVVEGASWLFEYEDSIQAYLDPPKTLEELHLAVSNPRKGYEIHHIVEQTSAEKEGFSRSIIDDPDNLVRIPKFKHWQINGWSGRPNPAFGGLSPREYLRGKHWDERVRVGLEALIEHGVLKP
jgi:hypothetical protein